MKRLNGLFSGKTLSQLDLEDDSTTVTIGSTLVAVELCCNCFAGSLNSADAEKKVQVLSQLVCKKGLNKHKVILCKAMNYQ